MEIKRDRYLQKLISYMWDRQVKVITGIRRCGKSYLLRTLFKKYLLEQSVPDANILCFDKPFSLIGDSFPKIIVRYDIRKRWYNENGVLNIGLIDFLLDDTVI